MAPSRLRLGPARAPTLFGVLAAGALIAALVITGRSQHLARPTGRRRGGWSSGRPAERTTPLSPARGGSGWWGRSLRTGWPVS